MGKFLKESKLAYNNNLMFEDIYLYVDLYQLTKSIYISRDIKYVYVKHSKSLTASLRSLRIIPRPCFMNLKPS